MIGTKREKYELLCRQVESLAAGETNVVGVLANVSAAMKAMFPEEFFWVGFYQVEELSREVGKELSREVGKELSREVGKELSREVGKGWRRQRLLLGPFQGTVACYSIPYGKGVCGTAWRERRTLVVPDVEAFPGHIACSSLSRSEIVVPMFRTETEPLTQEDETDGCDAEDVWGVIDIDSTELATFDAVDAEYLEKIARILAKELRDLI